MPSVRDTPSRLAQALEAASGRPFCWGRHDCATWAFELRHALLGGEDVAARWRGRYRTAGGALRVMRRLGWVSLEAMGHDLLGAPLPSPRLAQRGDIVLGAVAQSGAGEALGTGPAFGICTGAQAAFVAPAGLLFLPLAHATHAWRS